MTEETIGRIQQQIREDAPLFRALVLAAYHNNGKVLVPSHSEYMEAYGRLVRDEMFKNGGEMESGQHVYILTEKGNKRASEMELEDAQPKKAQKDNQTKNSFPKGLGVYAELL